MLGISRKASPLNDATEQEQDPDLDNFLSGIHTIDNPEYSPPEPADRTEYDFFIKNRNTRSDSIAQVIIDLNKQTKQNRAEGKSSKENQDKINELLGFIKKENENRNK